MRNIPEPPDLRNYEKVNLFSALLSSLGRLDAMHPSAYYQQIASKAERRSLLTREAENPFDGDVRQARASHKPLNTPANSDSLASRVFTMADPYRGKALLPHLACRSSCSACLLQLVQQGLTWW